MKTRCQPGVAREEGFVLMGVLVLMALMLIALAVAAPRMADDIRRDKELELQHRGQQYIRAVKLYYKKFGAYPTSIDQLEKLNQIRFLRKRYTDPLTGKDDWKIIHFGEQHIKSTGFFGKPLESGDGTSAAGSATPTNGTGSAFNNGSSMNSGSSFGGSAFGGSNAGGSAFGGGPTTPPGTGATGGPGSTNGTSATSPGLGNAGPIIGVASPDKRASIKEYKKQKHYNEWEFFYDPANDTSSSASLFGGSSTSSTNNNSNGGAFGGGAFNNGGNGGAFNNGGSNGGSNSGGSIFNNNGGSGSPTQPTQPTQPTNPQ